MLIFKKRESIIYTSLKFIRKTVLRLIPRWCANILQTQIKRKVRFSSIYIPSLKVIDSKSLFVGVFSFHWRNLSFQFCLSFFLSIANSLSFPKPFHLANPYIPFKIYAQNDFEVTFQLFFLCGILILQAHIGFRFYHTVCTVIFVCLAH